MSRQQQDTSDQPQTLTISFFVGSKEEKAEHFRKSNCKTCDPREWEKDIQNMTNISNICLDCKITMDNLRAKSRNFEVKIIPCDNCNNEGTISVNMKHVISNILSHHDIIKWFNICNAVTQSSNGSILIHEQNRCELTQTWGTEYENIMGEIRFFDETPIKQESNIINQNETQYPHNINPPIHPSLLVLKDKQLSVFVNITELNTGEWIITAESLSNPSIIHRYKANLKLIQTNISDVMENPDILSTTEWEVNIVHHKLGMTDILDMKSYARIDLQHVNDIKCNYSNFRYELTIIPKGPESTRITHL